jgi:hypothetical protein
MNPRLIASSIAALLVLAAAPAWPLDPKAGTVPTGQPPDEAVAQKLLPRLHDKLWSELSKCTVDYDNDKGTYSIHLTPDVMALDGKTITVRGFVLPMDGSDRTRHFLLSRNTPVCMYCPPGQPNEVVEVKAAHAIPWTDKIVLVTGKLSLINDEEKALFFKIENAEAK